jgi:phenylalanyl-tRNA synthetase beta chain
MLIPLQWLQDYVALPSNPADLVDRLTIAGLEVGSVQVLGFPVPEGLRVKLTEPGPEWEPDKVVVAKVLEISKVPSADKLKFVKLDYGAAEPKTVITGAPNIAPGESGFKVVLGLRGCKYFFQKKVDEPKAIITLEPKKLMGHDNDAMCMSNFELGIAEDHDGIIILDDNDGEPGTPITKLLGDIVLEIDVLPNMARCLAMLGIAREVAALTGTQVCTPELSFPTTAEKAADRVKIEIRDPSLCSRYSAMILTDVKIGRAPRMLRTRLQYAGMRPINNAVDITNYVMLEYGQPLHAFDYDVLRQRAGDAVPTIVVRRAVEGERLKTLDGVDRELSVQDLVIADTVGPIALAGVMGGLETEVTEKTTKILLESASFDFVSVRKTARRLNLFSEASTRFSRGVHPELVPLAAQRAAQLFHRHAGANVLSGLVDSYPAPLPPQVVELNRNEIERLLGVRLPDGEVERILKALEFRVEESMWGWTVTVPPNRLDIQTGAADLIEELARVSGYDRLPERMLAIELPEQKGNPELAFEDRVRDLLADFGLQECITYALTGVAEEAKLFPGQGGSLTAEKFVSLLNPISPERAVMRRTLLPSLLNVAATNLEPTTGAAGVALFELGFVYQAKGSELPDEPRHLAVVLTGRKSTAAWDDAQGDTAPQYDFYDLKGVFEQLLKRLSISDVSFKPATDVPHLHPGRSASIFAGETLLGSFGELHPKSASGFGLKGRIVLVGELNFELLAKVLPTRVAYRSLSEFPPILRDIAIVVAEDVTNEKVEAEIRAGGAEALEKVQLFDVYRGESIPTGTKSLAYALTYRLANRQLTDKEADKLHQKVEGRLKHMLKATIRGQV